VDESSKRRKLPNILRMPAMLALICSSVSSWRVSSRPDGSPDLGGASAHEHDGAVPRLLQAIQQHDLHQATDVQAVGRGVKTDVGTNNTGRGALIERGRIGLLMDVAALS
jgi:hypothetical protein